MKRDTPRWMHMAWVATYISFIIVWVWAVLNLPERIEFMIPMVLGVIGYLLLSSKLGVWMGIYNFEE